MEIDKIKIIPATESINPEFMFDIDCILDRNREIPLEISGHVLSENNKKLANIHQIFHFENHQNELSASEDTISFTFFQFLKCGNPKVNTSLRS